MLIMVPMGMASKPIIAIIIAAILAQLLPLYKLHAMNNSSKPITIRGIPSMARIGTIPPIKAPEAMLSIPAIASKTANMATPVGRLVGCCITGC